MNEKLKKILTFVIICVAVPAVAVAGMYVSGQRSYYWIAILTAALSCVPFFISFEKGKSGIRKMLVIAVMTAVSVAGRIVFAEIPSFKPVTALVMITALSFGPEAGFITGSLSAILSNLWFGQGPWTAFQMFAWGFNGFLTGLAARPLKKHLSLLVGFGALMGVLYSFILDINTILWMDGVFNLKRYIAILGTSARVTVIYMISNALFLLVLAKPMGKTLDRVRKKYNIS